MKKRESRRGTTSPLFLALRFGVGAIHELPLARDVSWFLSRSITRITITTTIAIATTETLEVYFRVSDLRFGISRLRRDGTLDRIRTCDLWFRRPSLYPAELRAHIEISDTDYSTNLVFVKGNNSRFSRLWITPAWSRLSSVSLSSTVFL